MPTPFNKSTTTITGDAELRRKLAALGPTALKVAAGSLYRSAEEIMTESKEKYVPVDTGNLRASGHVDLPETQGNSVSVALGYGGPAGVGNLGGQTNEKDVGYAVHVHENPRAGKTGGTSPSGRPYRTWSTVGGWKYLETPLKASVNRVNRRFKEDIEEAYAKL